MHLVALHHGSLDGSPPLVSYYPLGLFLGRAQGVVLPALQVRLPKLIENLQKMLALATARRATSLRRTLARQRLASTARRLSVEVPRSALAAAPLTLAFAATSCAHSARKERRKQIRRRDSDADIHGLDHEPEDSEVVEWNPKNEPDWKCPYWDDDVVSEDE